MSNEYYANEMDRELNKDHRKVFVFGSNLAGRHGLGAALYARQNHGAIYGQAVGRQGNSYAIPTKDAMFNPLPLGTIGDYVRGFFDYAADHPEEEFELTPIGTGLAGYSKDQIWPLIDPHFDKAVNVILSESWYK